MSFDPENPYTIGSKNVQGGLPTNGQQLQFNSTTNLWEFVTVAVAGLGDLEFLRDKQLSGDLLSSTGFTLAVAPVTVTSITPASGKTFFIAHSTQDHSNEVAGGSGERTELQNDGTAKDIRQTRTLDDTTFDMLSAIVGDSLIGDGAVLYRIQKTLGAVNMNAEGTILGWIQDT